MKIYFTAAISASEELHKNYEGIVACLVSLGHKVFSEHILKGKLEKIFSDKQEDHEKYYKSMVKEITKADLLVAEVSFPSTVHVGHELTLALEKDKPVLALHIKGKKPVLLWGNTSDKFFVEEYNLEDLRNILKDAIEYLSDKIDVRFNFFVPPKIVTYLDWIAKQERMPRAVYLRKLIEKDKEENGEYTEEFGQ